MMNESFDVFSAGVVEFGIYKSIKPIDDFVNNFRFYIESFDVDFLRVKNYTVPTKVKIVFTQICFLFIF